MTCRRRILFVDHTAVLGGGEIALLSLVRYLDPEPLARKGFAAAYLGRLLETKSPMDILEALPSCPNGDGGLVVQERDPAAIAKAITYLQANPTQAREMGCIGRRQAESRYTWARVAARMADIYRRVLAANPSPVPV